MSESLFLKKLQVFWAANLEKRLRHRCFPVNCAKFLRIYFFIEHLRWLLLKERYSESHTFHDFQAAK